MISFLIAVIIEFFLLIAFIGLAISIIIFALFGKGESFKEFINKIFPQKKD